MANDSKNNIAEFFILNYNVYQQMACECSQFVCENDIRRPGERRFRQSLDPVTGVPFGKVQIIEGSIFNCELNQTDGGCIDRRTHAFKKKSIYSFQVWNQRRGV